MEYYVGYDILVSHYFDFWAMGELEKGMFEPQISIK